MSKEIYFEEVKRKKSLYLADHCISDPKFLSEKELKKFKKKVINNYHWHNDRKMKVDHKYLRRFLKKKSKDIFNDLNRYHNLNKTDKFWNTIIYPWLTIITYILFDRWEIINSLKTKKKFVFNTFQFDEKLLIPETMREIKYVDDKFNLMLYTKIVDFIGLKCRKNKFILKKKSKENYPKFTFLKLKILKFISYFFNNKIVFNNCGLTFYNRIKLDLFFKQFPFPWINPPYKKNEIDIEKRKKFFKKKGKKKNFEFFFDEYIYLLVPKSYLEDFNEINYAIENSYWPKACKNIFTCYEYKQNDIFKIWVSKMRCNGSKYYIIQHGGNYGSPEYSIEEDMQKIVSDRFLTWGWGSTKDKKVKKFNAFPLNFARVKKWSKKNDKILVCIHYHSKFSHRVTSLPKNNFDRLNKLYQIKKFTENLSNKNIVIRYPKQTSKQWNINIKENYFSDYIKFDHGDKNYRDIISNYRLTVHDNDSTTFLISMLFNLPTILILDKKIEKFRPEAKLFYNQLKKKNIIFYDPISAAKFINKIGSSVEKWWFSYNLQKTRNIFCSKFVKKSFFPIKDLKKLI